MRSAIEDVTLLERWGYSRTEALELVTRRAVFEARQMAEMACIAPDRHALERQLLYLDELRALCLSAARPPHPEWASVRPVDRRREKRGPEVSAASADAAPAAWGT